MSEKPAISGEFFAAGFVLKTPTPSIHKKETRLKLQFATNTDQSIRAGLDAVEAMARRFGLWEMIRQLSCLDPRNDKV